ncbi:MAG: precorrin-3B C(17)-methyltransferase [Thermodesulfovibrionales bacterium]|nr:precorrin-3B C(17)-methyltransferase [Thermodesulfovibrionales bacterium]
MDIENNTAILYITGNGFALAKKLNSLYPEANAFKFKPDSLSKFWGKHKSFIFIMAAGIVVRTIAPLIKNKKTDPAVVVLDEKGRFSVSLLSGHLGGANKLAKEIADFLGGQAVITTASDTNNLPAIDLWAKENDLAIENWDTLPEISIRFLNSGELRVYSEVEIKMPEGFLRVNKLSSADMLITSKKNRFTHSPIHPFTQLYLRPKNLIIGIGCNKRTPENEIENAVKDTLAKNNLSFQSIHSIATIDIKGNELGLIASAKKYNLGIKTFTANELNTIKWVSKSDAAFKATGANAVAEPAALLASGADKLLVKKQKQGNVTVAIAELYPFTHSPIHPLGKIFIVGTGPGSIEHITPYARNAIRNSDVIVGYGTYLHLIWELISGKEVVSTGMTQEVDRCKKAVELAMSGKTVSVISGGDPGIYAMAGLVFEILKNCNALSVMRNEIKKSNASRITHHASRIAVEVIPGISALNACAARLGAPLMHDFASISLSDRLTPWDLIEKRLDGAAKADFVIILYNPKSKGRAKHIDRAMEIILKCRKSETPVGIVKGAMREDEKVIISDLKNMLEHDIDMQTTVIIGNSQTFVWDNRMITPRGYEGKLKVARQSGFTEAGK